MGAGRVYLWLGGTSTLGGSYVSSLADVIYSGTQAGSQFGAHLAQDRRLRFEEACTLL